MPRWWHHQMEAFSALLALSEIKRSPVKGPIMRILAFLWYGCALTVKQVFGWLVIWDYITFTWRHCNVVRNYTSMSMGSLNWKQSYLRRTTMIQRLVPLLFDVCSHKTDRSTLPHRLPIGCPWGRLIFFLLVTALQYHDALTLVIGQCLH